MVQFGRGFDSRARLFFEIALRISAGKKAIGDTGGDDRSERSPRLQLFRLKIIERAIALVADQEAPFLVEHRDAMVEIVEHRGKKRRRALAGEESESEDQKEGRCDIEQNSDRLRHGRVQDLHRGKRQERHSEQEDDAALEQQQAADELQRSAQGAWPAN